MKLQKLTSHLNEAKKEDDLYFEGPFWIIGDCAKDIVAGRNLFFECTKVLCDYNGIIKQQISKNSLTHKNIWKNSLTDKYNNVDYDYYPRGRVAIYEGTAFIHINSLCNNPKIIDYIIKEYGLQKLQIEVELNDVIQGSHYAFKIK